MIVPPQLRECVASIGIQLDEEEMEKLWTRYDLQGAGAISSSYFFKQIGLDGHGHPHVRIVSPGRHGKNTSRRYPKTSWVPNIPEDPDEAVDNVEETPREEVEHQLLSIPDPTFRPPSVDVVTYLTRKFEHNFHALRMGLEHFDHEGIGMVSRPDFRKVMVEYDFPMTALDCEHFLERCGVRTNDGKVNYKELLLKFMSRAEKDLAHKIISDPDHKFNNRVSTPYGFLTATDVEAKMVEYFHKDFLQLLASFRNLDKHNLGLITQKQLRDTINRINNVKCTDDQFAQLLEEIGLEDDGLVSYQKFLSLFNRKRPWTLIGVSTISTPSPRTPLQRPHTVGSVQVFTPRKEEMPPSPPPPPPQQVDKTQQTVPVTPPEYEKKWEKAAKKVGISEGSERTYHLRARPRAMLEDAIEDLLKNRFHTAQKAYHRIDRKAVGRISKPQFHKWLSELEIMLNVQELDDLWSTLQVGKDGIVHFSEIYVHFTQGREGPPPIEGKLPVESSSELVDHMKKVQQAQRQKAKELQEKAILEKERRDKVKMEKRARKMSPREHFGPPSDNLLERLRPEVVKNWNELKKQFRILDPNGYAIVKRVQVKALLQSLKFPITPEEADKLCSRFDFNVDGHFHYMQFLQLYTVPEKITSAAYCKENKLPEKYSSGTEKSDTLIAVMGKVRKRLLTEWKILRRAFKKADCNNEGVLDTLEFKQILIDNNITTSEEDIYHLLCEFDRKLDGKIVYDEFLNVIMG
ncbi:EF-hand calcium-binding domain-containing protein 6-like [Glandiceps talaboti]